MDNIFKLFDETISEASGYVKDIIKVSEIIREFERQTTSSFVAWKVEKNFGETDPCATGHKVLWCDKKIPYDGTPYLVLGGKILDCQHGKDRKKTAKQKKNNESEDKSQVFVVEKHRTLPQDTKKMGCTAQIVVREIMKFPEHKLSMDTAKRRRNMSEKLRQDLREKTANGERRFYINLPLKHDFHIIGEGRGIQQHVEPLVKEKIHELVGSGVRSVDEVTHHVGGFVDKLTNCDQTNVSEMVDQVKQEDPQDSLHFRPDADIQNADVTYDINRGFHNEEDSEEDEEDVRIESSPSQQNYKPHVDQPTAPIHIVFLPSVENTETHSDIVHNNNQDSCDNILPVPTKKSFLLSQAAKVRKVLGNIRKVTFLVDDEEALKNLHTTLLEAQKNLEKSVKKDDGLPLELTPQNERQAPRKRKNSEEGTTHLGLPTESKKHKSIYDLPKDNIVQMYDQGVDCSDVGQEY